MTRLRNLALGFALVAVVVAVVLGIGIVIGACHPKDADASAGTTPTATNDDAAAGPSTHADLARLSQGRSAHADAVPSGGGTAGYDAAAPADPRAAFVCDALYGLADKQKSACCHTGTGASAMLSTCTGLLSDALAKKAVTLDDAKAHACVAARTQELEGCNWIATLAPETPAACTDILTGALDDGAPCRSSVDCQPGLRCHGATVVAAGRCGKPLAAGARCGGTLDALALVVGQAAIDKLHPECAGVCSISKCMDPKAVDDPCSADVECGAGNRCEDGRCAGGRVAVGAACKRSGCVDGARCMDGTCQPLRPDGGACHADFDCARGACVKDTPRAPAGVCGMRCTTTRR